jgi:3-hydroxyisobutyrate dehydrogenase-like beta-hydroxyacid dehydrogenase
MNDTPTPVTFIGLGIMGEHMAGHILAAGHPLHVYNRTRTKPTLSSHAARFGKTIRARPQPHPTWSSQWSVCRGM